MSMRVAVLGATGAIGATVVRQLADLRDIDLTACTRRATHFPDRVRHVQLDVRDRDGLATVAAGHDLIVNCAGPSCDLSGNVVLAAREASTDLIDPGFTTIKQAATGTVELLHAGFMPGLTAMTLRWAATRVPCPSTITGYAGGIERLTHAAAVDFAISLAAQDAGAQQIWNLGPVPSSKPPTHRTEGFSTSAVPARNLVAEIRRTAEAASLVHVDWNLIFDGDQIQRLLPSLALRLQLDGDTASAAAELVAANRLDIEGRKLCQRIELHLDLDDCSTEVAVTTPDSYYAAAGFIVQLVLAIGQNSIAPGTHFAGEVADVSILDALHEAAIIKLTCLDHTPNALEFGAV